MANRRVNALAVAAYALLALPLRLGYAQIVLPLPSMLRLELLGRSISNGILTTQQIAAALAIVDSAKTTLITLRENYAVVLSSGQTDRFGRTLDEDMHQYCLSPPAQTVLEMTRSSVLGWAKNGDFPRATSALRALAQNVAADARQCSALTVYWHQFVEAAPDWGPYDEVLRASGIAPHEAAALDALAAQLDSEAHDGAYLEIMAGTWPRMEALRTKAAGEDSADLAKRAMMPGFHGLYAVSASATCSPLAPASSGMSYPTLDPRNHTPPPDYPADAHAKGEIGSVSVGIIVSAQGCARLAFVLESSGFAALDRAAVGYASQLRFLPAQRQGHPVEKLAVLPVHFNIRNP